jgi:hypothetical protein
MFWSFSLSSPIVQFDYHRSAAAITQHGLKPNNRMRPYLVCQSFNLFKREINYKLIQYLKWTQQIKFFLGR